MIRKLIQSPFRQLNFQAKKKFSEINTDEMAGYLQKRSTQFTQQNDFQFKKLLFQMSQNKQSQVGIYKMYFWTKVLMVVSRYQVFAYCIGCTLYTFYTGYYKYQDFKKKNTKRARRNMEKIINLGSVLILSSILGIWLTMFMGKRIIKTISYIPKDNSLELQFLSLFCRTKSYNIPIKNLVPLKEKLRFDSTAQYQVQDKKLKKYSYVSTYGTGKLSNKQLLPYLIENQAFLQNWYNEYQENKEQYEQEYQAEIQKELEEQQKQKEQGL